MLTHARPCYLSVEMDCIHEAITVQFGNYSPLVASFSWLLLGAKKPPTGGFFISDQNQIRTGGQARTSTPSE
jgi:hypothetical protein